MTARIKKRIILISFIHWFYSLGFIILYWMSFWVERMEKPFLFLAGATIAAWIPYKDCPLMVWENRLREKLNLNKRHYFTLTHILYSVLKKSFGIQISAFTTLYLIAILVVVKILV